MCKVITVKAGNKTVRIADIKRKYISNIVDAAKKCDFIDRIVLFGSSIEKHCKKTSDIDIAVFGKHAPSRALSSKKGSHKKPVVKMAESIENTGLVRKQR